MNKINAISSLVKSLLYCLYLMTLISCNNVGQSSTLENRHKKTRVIVTTDGEGDDRCSMVRFLLYTNEFDVKGLIKSSSKFHWKGNDSIAGYKWKDDPWIIEQVDAYAKVYPNLILHDKNYPSPEQLREQIFTGNIELPGDMETETDGSNHIVDVLLAPDKSPVWLQAWGGSNTIARALKTIEEKYPERKDEVSDKARIFLIMFQDSTYLNYIQHSWPKLTVLVSTAFESIGYSWRKRVPNDLQKFYKGEWMNENILLGHGELCNVYTNRLYKPNRRTGDFISEGDSPAFMHEIQTGLDNIENPSYGGWGGRFKWNDKYWASATDDTSKFKTIYRWIPAFQNDFAARADWCVMKYNNANHPPIVNVNYDEEITALPGDNIELNANKSIDPDGDKLDFYWWQYADADSYPGKIQIEEITKPNISFRIPDDFLKGQEIHLICEVCDNGVPSLTRYKRIIIKRK